jgi:hypothetical protein
MYKRKDSGTKSNNFAGLCMWVWNLVCRIEGMTWNEGVREQIGGRVEYLEQGTCKWQEDRGEIYKDISGKTKNTDDFES